MEKRDSVEIMQFYSSNSFLQRFRGVNVSTNKLYLKLISREIFQVRVNFCFFYTVPEVVLDEKKVYLSDVFLFTFFLYYRLTQMICFKDGSQVCKKLSKEL